MMRSFLGAHSSHSVRLLPLVLLALLAISEEFVDPKLEKRGKDANEEDLKVLETQVREQVEALGPRWALIESVSERARASSGRSVAEPSAAHSSARSRSARRSCCSTPTCCASTPRTRR